MKVGALHSGGNRCEFRLFAPEAKQVRVEIVSQGDRAQELQRGPRGHWSVTLEDVRPGDLYGYRLDGGERRADPASFHQPQGVHGMSAVVDPNAYHWGDPDWRGIPLEEMIAYELHVGTFTPEGTFDAVLGKLDHLRSLGVNTLELMPVHQFPGSRNWGYDNAFLFAAQNSYGGPDGLKRLVDGCHRHGFAVILDVVYNHFGPEGVYLREFGPFFTKKYATPWGQAVNFDGPCSDQVREFFIENALYWLGEFHLDALRLDAVHMMYDTSANHFLAELGHRVRDFNPGNGGRRFLIAESDLNDPRLLKHPDAGGLGMDAQWLDDFHHCLDVMLNRDKSDYAKDYGTPFQLMKAFKEGFVYSGEFCPTRHMHFGRSSADRPGRQFFAFIQNHDQVGNRLTGDRLSTMVDFESLKLAVGTLLLSPYVPMLFMGEEWGESNPFLYFVSHSDAELVEAVRKGRAEAFGFLKTSGETPDPQSEDTFQKSKLDWNRLGESRHALLLGFYREMIRLRRTLPALKSLDKRTMDFNHQGLSFFLHRWQGDSEIYCFLNFEAGEKTYRAEVRGDGWNLLLDSADERFMGPGGAAPPKLEPGQEVRLQGHSFALYLRELPGRGEAKP